MINKKVPGLVCVLIFILVLSFTGIGCAVKDVEEPSYSKAIAEDFLVAVSNSDYEAVSDLLSEDFKKSLKEKATQKTGEETIAAGEKEGFIDGICKPLNEKIGSYEKGSLVFTKTLTERGYTSVFYNTRFSKETQGAVTVQFVFEEVNNKMLVAGFWLSSKTLKR